MKTIFHIWLCYALMPRIATTGIVYVCLLSFLIAAVALWEMGDRTDRTDGQLPRALSVAVASPCLLCTRFNKRKLVHNSTAPPPC